MKLPPPSGALSPWSPWAQAGAVARAHKAAASSQSLVRFMIVVRFGWINSPGQQAQQAGHAQPGPVRRHRAHGIQRQGACLVQARQFGQHAPQHPRGEDHQQLADFHTQVECQQRQEHMLLGQADVLDGPGEAQAVDQAEAESHQRRPAPCQRFAAVQCLGGHQQDGQRDHRFHGRRAQCQPAHGAEPQRQAVGDGEGGDGPHQPAIEAHQEEQRHDEQQVVQPGEDVNRR